MTGLLEKLLAPSRGTSGAKKTSWDPCVVCADPNGKIYGNNRTPMRYDLANLHVDGLVGLACHNCYCRIAARLKRLKEASTA